MRIILLYAGDSVLPSLRPRCDGYSPDSAHSVGIFAYILKFRISLGFFFFLVSSVVSLKEKTC